MNRDLRNKHRLVWSAFVVIAPAIIALGLVVAPLNDTTKETGLPSMACASELNILSTTDVAVYGICEDVFIVDLTIDVRVPRLAVHLKEIKSGGEIVASGFFGSQDFAKLNVSKMSGLYQVTLKDLIREETIDELTIEF